MLFRSILGSVFNKVLMDEILPYGQVNKLISMSIGFGLIIVVNVILESLRKYMVIHLSQRIDIRMMMGYFTHIFKLPVNFFASRRTGEITTRYQDATIVKDVLTSTALTLVIDILMAVVTGVILCVMSWRLFIVIIVLTILNIILIYAFKGPYKRLNKKGMTQNAILNSQIIESLKGINSIKACASEQGTIDKIESEYIRTVRIGYKQGIVSNVQYTFSDFLGQIGNLVLMALGIYFAIEGHFSLGTMMAFMSISGYFLGPIGRLINMQLSIQEANISLKRLSEIYDIDEEDANENNKPDLTSAKGDIDIKDLSFRYGLRQPVLKGINMHINQGEKIAIVGESGCGKTTITKLLMRFYSPESGSILINDSDILSYNIYSVRNKIAYVPQNIEMFSGTVSDNIKCGRYDISENDVVRACEYAGCKEFISKLPAGYYSYLDEDGGGLSGGEKQRLSLARALASKPELLVLDEATSNLDFASENAIYETIFNKLSKTTTIIIAHRLSTIRACDRIYYMQGGAIVESGTHEELLATNGLYNKLWSSQVNPIKKKVINTIIEKAEDENDVEY